MGRSAAWTPSSILLSVLLQGALHQPQLVQDGDHGARRTSLVALSHLRDYAASLGTANIDISGHCKHLHSCCSNCKSILESSLFRQHTRDRDEDFAVRQPSLQFGEAAVRGYTDVCSVTQS